jgi:hypothetical protein
MNTSLDNIKCYRSYTAYSEEDMKLVPSREPFEKDVFTEGDRVIDIEENRKILEAKQTNSVYWANRIYNKFLYKTDDILNDDITNELIVNIINNIINELSEERYLPTRETLLEAILLFRDRIIKEGEPEIIILKNPDGSFMVAIEQED